MHRADADIYLYRGRPYLATVTYLLSRVLQSKWVYSLGNDSHVQTDPDALSAPVRALFERALDEASVVVAQTDIQADGLRERFGVESTVIPSGYPPVESTVPHDEREGVLWVGRLDREQKRPHLFLDVAEAVPETSFDLVGPGGQDASYNDCISNRAGKLENVTYHGPVDPDRIHDYYREAVALVNTSAYEGFPSTFLEAWRCDTPVLSLSVRPSRYATSEADAGYADDNPEELITLVRAVDSDPSNRGAISRPTYEYFRENLTIDAVVERYDRLFIDLLTDG